MFTCTACTKETDAIDRFDRCLSCSEGKPPKRKKGHGFHAPISDAALESFVARCESGEHPEVAVVLSRDEWSTTYRNPSTGFELRLLRNAEIERAPWPDEIQAEEKAAA